MTRSSSLLSREEKHLILARARYQGAAFRQPTETQSFAKSYRRGQHFAGGRIPERIVEMLKTHAVGIDLGTTYSSIAYLNEHGEPVTLANQEGELATPSVVLFEGDIPIVGTEALRNAISYPEYVVENSKRFIGTPGHTWSIKGRSYTPEDIATLILKKLLSAAANSLGPVDRATITVPAQFSNTQRELTAEAGRRAGLKHVDIINEPIAAALCYVLGTEGLWFTELAEEQRILVYDLGGGTFDLALVKYRKDEVSVIASDGDLNLGGINWNTLLVDSVSELFKKEFGSDPRSDRISRQSLANEVESTKRSLSVRPRAVLTCQHAGQRKTYQIEQAQFAKIAQPLVDRTARITQDLLKNHKMGWAHVDVILTTGGASRMPMIRDALKTLGGRTLNTSLSPDQSIVHGATYYSGMLLTNNAYVKSILNPAASERLSQMRHRSVNARALGILVRGEQTNKRTPHYLIPANSTLPASTTRICGTVIENQRRVNLHIVESGTSTDAECAILGSCVIEDLPAQLPEGSEIAVTIRYDEQARVHVSARDVTSGKEASTVLVRPENLSAMAVETPPEPPRQESPPKFSVTKKMEPVDPSLGPIASEPQAKKGETERSNSAAPIDFPLPASSLLEDSDRPIPLCDRCDEPLDAHGKCQKCRSASSRRANRDPQKQPGRKGPSNVKQTHDAPSSDDGRTRSSGQTRRPAGKPKPAVADDDIAMVGMTDRGDNTRVPPKPKRSEPPFAAIPPLPPADKRPKDVPPKKSDPEESDDDDFWQLLD